MFSDIYWINEKKIGEKKIGTMARPRGNDWLEDEIKGLKIRKIDCLVSMLEKSEEWELGLQQEAEICKKHRIEFISFPIQDVNIPKNENDFIQLACTLANRIIENKKVVIHCRMGIGRASMMAAATLINLGLEAKVIFETIGKYRKLNVPDTDEQRNWILSIEDELKPDINN